MAAKEYAPDLPKTKQIEEAGIVLDGTFDADSLQSHPELTSKVAAYIAHLSELDFRLECAALVAIGGGQGFAEALQAGMTPLEHAHRRSAVEKILRTKAGLSGNEVDKLFSGITEARTLRNSFAHGLWCTHSRVSDALILTKSHNELLRFGVGLDTMRGQSIRSAITEFIIDMVSSGGPLPAQFGPAVEKLTAHLKSPWDAAFSGQAQAAYREETLERQKWFEQNPDQNINWSKVQPLDEERVVLKSEILAMGGSVHSNAEIWDSKSLDQALNYARHIKGKAQILIDKLIQTTSSIST